LTDQDQDQATNRAQINELLRQRAESGGSADAALQSHLGELLGISAASVRVVAREGTQMKANVLWQGGFAPHHDRDGIALAITVDDNLGLTTEGAENRLRMNIRFPEAILVLSDRDGSWEVSHLLSYDDTDLGKELSAKLELNSEHLVSLPRPRFHHGTKAALDGEVSTQGVLEHLHDHPNIILQGPPGTGKTCQAQALIDLLAGGPDNRESCRLSFLLQGAGQDMDSLLADQEARGHSLPVVWEMIQLHPGYSYDDLVRRMTPVSSDGSLQFTVQDRLFPRLCSLAKARNRVATAGKPKPVVLIIDEVNRCDLAATLGELILAIDPSHRGEAVRLQYQGDGLTPSLEVPPNLWLVGTMNTADRSIAMVDYAIRRRFRFLDLAPDPAVLSRFYGRERGMAHAATAAMGAINAHVDSHLRIGHAYFMVFPEPSDTWIERLARRIVHEVLPMLREYDLEGLRGGRPVVVDNVELSTDPRHAEHTLRERLAVLVHAGSQ
jgi:5-methylcytosine-specific restriction protein B